jgi:nitrogen regulatory protein PII
MKMLTAIIKPHKLADVDDALARLGIGGITISEVMGHGRQKGHKEIYRGSEYEVAYIPKTKVEVVVEDHMAERASDAIIDAARTGNIGDGMIFIGNIGDAVRVRTGESGTLAL